MQCPDCGAFAGKEDTFCGECGKPLQTQLPSDEPVSSAEIKDQVTQIPEPPKRPLSPLPATPGAKRRPSAARLLILVGSALLLLGLCAGGALLWWSTTEEPSAGSSSGGPEPGDLLYEDDFEDPTRGWTTSSDEDTSAETVDGQYRIAIYKQDYMAWGNPEPGLELADFSLGVDARQVEGPLDNNFGLLFRLQEDGERFYWFQISADGYYSVVLSEADEWVSVVAWEESDAIYQGVGAINHLRVICSEDECEFYVNEIYLTSMADDTLRSGSIGLAAGAFDEPGVIVDFDNLSVHSVP